MRLVPLLPALAGKTLARTIFSAEGAVLLRAGVVLTPTYIARLQAKGYTCVYIHDDLFPTIEVGDVVSEHTRVLTTSRLKEISERLLHQRPVELSALTDVIERIMDEVSTNATVVSGITSLRAADEYTVVHSVNVCILTVILARALNYPLRDIRRLGLGAILHDVGKLKIPREILLKPGRLTPEEHEVVKQHPWDGFRMLKKRLPFNLLSPHVALQHHEKMNGTGYPRGLKGDKIHPFGRITAIADIFDAVTSDRVYRPKVCPHEGMSLLTSLAGEHLDPEMVETFRQHIAHYPNGTIVVMDSGELGVVAEQDPALSTRPLVRILADETGHPTSPYDIRLSSAPGREIAGVLPDFPPGFREAFARAGMQPG